MQTSMAIGWIKVSPRKREINDFITFLSRFFVVFFLQARSGQTERRTKMNDASNYAV
jgi:hypothetical protein